MKTKRSNISDFDPEALLDPAPSSSSEDEQSDLSGAEDDNAGREHYAQVGESRLRKKEAARLGPQYTGTQVSRGAIEDEDSDDPFAAPSDRDYRDSDTESGDDIGDGVDMGQPVLGSKESEDGEDGAGSEGGGDSEDSEVGEDGDSAAEEDDSESGQTSDDQGSEDGHRAELRAIMGKNKPETDSVRDLMKDQKSLTNSLAAAAQSDVEKGQAIKAQRKTFDSLLNTRVRLQKALISTNSMVAPTHVHETASASSIEAAEAAALTLLNNLTDMRASLEEARTGDKRKRADFTVGSPSDEIWDQLEAYEKAGKKQRKGVLEKWSGKTRSTKVATAQRQLNIGAEQTLTEVLESQLANSSHLVARTQMARSCAPLQSAGPRPVPDANVYDDADFYGLLLKELLEQRSADLSNNGAAEFVVQAPWQVAREAKTKKVVDTKASKGRRLRYTVHEKLQNFMAPEERGLWNEHQRDDLFSSLFGQRLGLGEQDDDDDDEASEGESAAGAEEQGLMLFRS